MLCLPVYSTSNVSTTLTHYTCLPVCGTDRTFYRRVQNDGDLHTPMGGHQQLRTFSSNRTQCSFQIFVLYYFSFITDVNPLISHSLDETAGLQSDEKWWSQSVSNWTVVWFMSSVKPCFGLERQLHVAAGNHLNCTLGNGKMHPMSTWEEEKTKFLNEIWSWDVIKTQLQIPQN